MNVIIQGQEQILNYETLMAFQTFFILVTVEGKVYACGEATNGRLGLGISSGTVPIPRQITALSNYVVKKVAVHSGTDSCYPYKHKCNIKPVNGCLAVFLGAVMPQHIRFFFKKINTGY